MVEWLKMRDASGNAYLVNADNIIYISKDGIEFRDGRQLKAQIDVDEVERVIAESRKTGERWLNGN